MGHILHLVSFCEYVYVLRVENIILFGLNIHLKSTCKLHEMHVFGLPYIGKCDKYKHYTPA